MRKVLLIIALALSSSATAAAAVLDDVEIALARVAKLKMMKAGETYSLPARGAKMTGNSEDFLERREPDEILSSGLSTGCGDYSAAFYGLLRAKGASLLYIQGVELSARSLLEQFAGHAAVAVKNPQNDRWILVDPTNRKVLDKNWDTASKGFHSPAGRFWIGYAGRLEDYPVKTPAQFKTSLRRTLRLVPAAAWDEEVVRLNFKAGPSMSRTGGAFANPRYPAFLARFSQVYDDLGLRPERQVGVEFADGGPGWGADCKRRGRDSWECPVGRDAAMDQKLFSWVESSIMRQMDESLPK